MVPSAALRDMLDNKIPTIYIKRNTIENIVIKPPLSVDLEPDLQIKKCFLLCSNYMQFGHKVKRESFSP